MGTGSVRGHTACLLLLGITLSPPSAEATVIHRGEADRVIHPCEVDTDCPPGFGCVDDELQGIEEDTGPTRSCLPRLCEGDGDCDGVTVCITVEVESCSDEDRAEDEPPCEPEIQRVCGPRWLAPCEADADCGDPAMSCMEEEFCPEGPDGEAPDEPCEPLGEFHCEFDIIPCAHDGDCPQSWGCIQAFRGEVSLDFEIPCPEGEREGDHCLREGEPGEEGGITHVCLPDGYGEYIGWTGGVAARASARGEAGPPGRGAGIVDEPAGGPSAAPENQGACGGGRHPGGAWWTLLALALLAGPGRLKVGVFGGAMTTAGRDEARRRLRD